VVSNESVNYLQIKSLVVLTSPDSGTYNVSDNINVTWHVYGDMPNGVHIGYTNGSGWVSLRLLPRQLTRAALVTAAGALGQSRNGQPVKT